MCVNPRILDSGVAVACRKCWQCSANYQKDWVGRCIAESQTAAHSSFVTLTYGPDEAGDKNHVRTAVLTYSDVQRYLKNLRIKGFPLRYFCVGEFGSKKGRAHWHLLLFWANKAPPHELGRRYNDGHWPHGFSEWDQCNAQSIRYVCKYIQKDLRDAERQRQVSMSKYPPLGAGYFNRLAGRYVDQGLSPVDAFYSFSGVTEKDGTLTQFHLRGAALDLFCASFERQWRERYGSHPPPSPLMSAYYDRVAPATHTLHMQPFKPGYGRPWIAPPAPAYFSEPHNSWACDHDGVTLFWSFDLKGNRAWQSVIRTEAQADLMRAAYEERQRSAEPKYREASKGPTR